MGSNRLPVIILSVFLFTLVLLLTNADSATPATGIYGFEPQPPSKAQSWGGGPAGTIAPDTTVFHGGTQAIRLHRTADSANGFSTVTLNLPSDRVGNMIELRGWLKSEDAQDWFGLWLRLDGPTGAVGFHNMQRRGLSGTTGWTEYSIEMTFSPETRRVVFGALISGAGTLWADDLSLWVDGKPWAEAPVAVSEPTVLEKDLEFARTSGCELTEASTVQVDNLALLGRVWGFLKYHHPRVVDGSRHWDFDLFRILPAVLAAADHEAALVVLDDWVASLGAVEPCSPCAQEAQNPAQKAPVAWLADTELLGDALSARLLAVYKARPAGGESFWVDFAPKVGNPVFDREPSYANLTRVDPGYRLLALFRFWNIVNYWSPNRDVIGEDWVSVLREFTPRMLGAADNDSYARQLLALVARLKDGHTQIYGALDQRPPGMAGAVPVRMRWVEEQPVVAGWLHEFGGPATGLQIGDTVLAVDGRTSKDLFDAWRPFYSASNPARRQNDLAAALMRGPLGSCELRVRRGESELDLTGSRMAYRDLDHQTGRWHTLPGRAFQMLEPDVAYLALNGIKTDSVTVWLEAALAAHAQGLIIDCRAYPSDFSIFALGGHLVAEATPFVTFTRADPENPGAFVWQLGPPLLPIAPYFAGPVVVLVDETSMSSAEYHALAFRAAPQAVVMGSTTAGADGNVSRFVLPGNLTTMISGIGIYDAQRNPTQRVGIVPDVTVTPTVAGLRSGRDEVLDAAIAEIIARAGGER